MVKNAGDFKKNWHVIQKRFEKADQSSNQLNNLVQSNT